MQITMQQRDKEIGVFFKYAQEMVTSKGKDYNPTGIAFRDLKENAEAMGLTKEQVLGVYMAKHYAAVQSFIKDPGRTTSEPVQGRLMDLANYCAMLAVMIEAEKGGIGLVERCDEDKKAQAGIGRMQMDSRPLTTIAEEINKLKAENEFLKNGIKWATQLIYQMEGDHYGRKNWLAQYDTQENAQCANGDHMTFKGIEPCKAMDMQQCSCGCGRLR